MFTTEILEMISGCLHTNARSELNRSTSGQRLTTGSVIKYVSRVILFYIIDTKALVKNGLVVHIIYTVTAIKVL